MQVTIRLALTGPREGETIELNGLAFTDGIAEYTGSEPEAANILRYFSRCYAVVEVDKDGNPLNPPKETTDVGIQNQSAENPDQSLSGNSDQGAGADSNGTAQLGSNDQANADNQNGQAEPTVAKVDERLRAALLQLDPTNDEHWTKLGKPAIAAVEPFYGSSGFTREDVEVAIPDFSRDVARANREQQESQG